MPNIVLIGFMGTGKSAIGRVIARALNFKFVDSDQMIEEVTGLTVNQIFRKHGEIRFRSEEDLVLAKLAKGDHLVIATGGGAILNHKSMEALKKNGYFVLLTADPEVILERVSRKNTRPLLAKGRNLENVNNLLAEREESYHYYADATIDTSRQDIEDSARQIIRIVKEKWSYEKS
ncbi:shikimate kinase [Dehalobacterium formicoaceticum]|uniref:shikimate kinase n=1 Tax=Dehalobacterium formicoaceticum TaxID=51515 RepID=UPI0031F64B97